MFKLHKNGERPPPTWDGGFFIAIRRFQITAIAFLPELADYDVPMLLLVQSGVGAKLLTPVISILIILGAVSTGVNMIAGIVERTTNHIHKKTGNEGRKYTVLASLLFTLLAFCIAQFGLIPLVRTGYSYIGYATLFVIIIPFVIHFFAHMGKKNSTKQEN